MYASYTEVTSKSSTRCWLFIMDAHMKHNHGCSFTCMSSSDSYTPYTTLTADAIARYIAPGNKFNLQWVKHSFVYIPRAQYALAFLLIHGVVQITMHITSRCTPHRTPNQYINRHTNHIFIYVINAAHSVHINYTAMPTTAAYIVRFVSSSYRTM